MIWIKKKICRSTAINASSREYMNLRKFPENKGSLPSDDALLKLFYWGLANLANE